MTDAVEITPGLLARLPLPRTGAETDKNARGRILVVAGSGRVPGAALLCADGAMRAGAGKLQMAAPAAFAQALAFAMPEAMVVAVAATASDEASPLAAGALADLARDVDAVVVGPGLLEQGAAGELACALLAAAIEARFVIDAAALTGLLGRPEARSLCAGRAVLTPHAGEMASLMQVPIEAVEADPSGFARKASDRFDAVVAMKGSDTHIATPDGRAWINRSGAPGLATSGSGDVLAGVIGGLAARGADAATAAVWGVFLHAQAGAALSAEVGRLGFLAREIAGRIPSLLDRFDPA